MLILGALLVGLSLGLLGSGGSILTVPILVYGLGQGEKEAIAGSLAIVGGIATVGALFAASRGRVVWRSVALFGPAGMLGTALGAEIARALSGAVQLAIFAIVMLAAAIAMLQKSRSTTKPAPAMTVPSAPRSGWKIAAEGAGVGVLTGVVGVGGGFLIVPALTLFGGLPIELAIGTSLTLIALNAWTGFFRHLGELAALGIALDPRGIVTFIALGGAGTLAGSFLGGHLPQRTLTRLFGIALLGLGVFVLWSNLPMALRAMGHD